jgi:hypothetical protein
VQRASQVGVAAALLGCEPDADNISMHGMAVLCAAG